MHASSVAEKEEGRICRLKGSKSSWRRRREEVLFAAADLSKHLFENESPHAVGNKLFKFESSFLYELQFLSCFLGDQQRDKAAAIALSRRGGGGGEKVHVFRHLLIKILTTILFFPFSCKSECLDLKGIRTRTAELIASCRP
jgi:hypothetical protein